MKARLNTLSWLRVRTTALLFIPAFTTETAMYAHTQELSDQDDKLEKKDSGLNRQYLPSQAAPFYGLYRKKPILRGTKNHQMVVLEGKTPKGDEIRLTSEAFMQLEKWLFTENIR